MSHHRMRPFGMTAGMALAIALLGQPRYSDEKRTSKPRRRRIEADRSKKRNLLKGVRP